MIVNDETTYTNMPSLLQRTYEDSDSDSKVDEPYTKRISPHLPTGIPKYPQVIRENPIKNNKKILQQPQPLIHSVTKNQRMMTYYI